MRHAFDDRFETLTSTLTKNNFLTSERSCEELLRTLHDKIQDKVASSGYQDIR